MGDTSLAKLSGFFALLSAALILFAIATGMATGGRGPAAMNFGDPATLEALAAGLAPGGGRSAPMEWLALVCPVLALGAGLGWWALLRSGRTYAALGILLWYLGMIFVIWQDALELVLAQYVPVDLLAGEGEWLAAGALLGDALGVVMPLGDFISSIGLLLVGLALSAKGGQWRLVGGLAVVSSFAIVIGLAVPALAPLRLLGAVLFIAWMIAMGVAMLRWRPDPVPA